MLRKTKVFFKNVESYAHLLNEMAAIEHNAAVKVQAMWRQSFEKKKFLHALTCVKHLKNLLVTKIHRQRFLKKKEAAIKMQNCFRTFKARNLLELAKKDKVASRRKEFAKRWENAFLCMKKTRENLRNRGWAYKKGAVRWKEELAQVVLLLYEDSLSYYRDMDVGDKPLGFKGSAMLTKVEDVFCEKRNSFFFRDKKMSREKTETYILVMKMEGDSEMLLGADNASELDEWKEAIKFAVEEQKLLEQAKTTEDKLPTVDVETVEKMLREVEIKHK